MLFQFFFLNILFISALSIRESCCIQVIWLSEHETLEREKLHVMSERTKHCIQRTYYKNKRNEQTITSHTLLELFNFSFCSPAILMWLIVVAVPNTCKDIRVVWYFMACKFSGWMMRKFTRTKHTRKKNCSQQQQ